MAILFVVTGFCGSGKTYHLERIGAALGIKTVNEGLLNPLNDRDRNELRDLLADLNAGRDCAISDINWLSQGARDAFRELLRERAPATKILSLVLERDKTIANENCRRDPQRPEAAAGRCVFNEDCDAVWSDPPNALWLKMHALPAQP